MADALASRRHGVEELFVTAEAARRDADVLRAADDRDVRITLVSNKVAAALSDTVTPQGVVAVVRAPAASLDAALSSSPRLVVALLDAGDPGNVGAIIRTADAAGADAIVLAGDSVDPHNSKCIRASAGSIFHLPVAVARDAAQIVGSLRSAGLLVAATSADATEDLYDVADRGVLSKPVAWLFGNEAHGLPTEVVDAADLSVRIPILGQAESLNLAAAAAVCLYATAQARRGGAGS